jgi:hypothetical protein
LTRAPRIDSGPGGLVTIDEDAQTPPRLAVRRLDARPEPEKEHPAERALERNNE